MRSFHRRRCGTLIRLRCSCRCWSFPSSTCWVMTRWVQSCNSLATRVKWKSWKSRGKRALVTPCDTVSGQAVAAPYRLLNKSVTQHSGGRAGIKPGLDVVHGGKYLSVLDCNLFSSARYHNSHTPLQQQQRISGFVSLQVTLCASLQGDVVEFLDDFLDDEEEPHLESPPKHWSKQRNAIILGFFIYLFPFICIFSF